MRKASTFLFTLIALVAAGALAVGAGFGFEAVDTSVVLTSPKDWLHAFTAHADGAAILADGGLGAVATKELKDQIDRLVKNTDEILGEDGLEDQIKEAKNSASQLKEEVEKRSLDNAEYVDKLKEVILDAKYKAFKEDLTEILDERQIELLDKINAKGGGTKGLNAGETAAKAVKEAGLSSTGGPGQKAKVELEGTSIKEITNAAASAGDAVWEDRREEIFGIQLRQPRVIDLLTVIGTDSDVIEYVEQASETDSASPQAGQGTALSESDMTFERKSVNVETIGHFVRTAAQILDDAPRLRGFIDTRMRQLLALELEDQVLLGDGTGNNLNGLVPQSTAYDTALETAVVDGTASDLDRIRVGILQVQRANFPATGIILSPLNWAAIELDKDNEGRYKFVNPQTQTGPRLWGLPVVATNALPEGTGHVGNYQIAATFYDRMQASLQISTEDGDNFKQLMATIRAYLRATQAVEYPEALIDIGTMDATAPV